MKWPMEIDSAILFAGSLMAIFAWWILRSRAKAREEKLRETVSQQEIRLERQTKELLDERNARQLLEDRIVGEVATFNSLYESARSLTHLNPEHIRQGAMHLMNVVLKAQAGSLYESDAGQFKRTARFASGDAAVPSEVLSVKDPLVALLTTRGRLVSIRDLLVQDQDIEKSDFLALAPVFGDGRSLVGFLALERIDFLRFSSVTLQLMERLADWISQSYSQARRASALEERQLIEPTLGVFSSAAMGALLREARTGTAASIRLTDISGLPDETVHKLLASLTTLIESGSGLLVFKGLDAGELALWSPTLGVAEVEQRMNSVRQRFESLGLQIPGQPSALSIQWRIFSVNPGTGASA